MKSNDGDERERGERNDTEPGHMNEGENLAILLSIESSGDVKSYRCRCAGDDSDERLRFGNSRLLRLNVVNG